MCSPHRVAPLLALLLLAACGSDEPVLTGVPAPEAAPASDPTPGEPILGEDAGQTPAADQPVPYQRAEGVQVDIRYLGGKVYSEVRDVVADQLGALQSTEDLPGDNGRQMVFERGELRLLDDRIIRVRVPLEPALRRADALAATGFPNAAGHYITLHREYRLNHEWGFRRIRMMRENGTSELVTAVDAWLRVPGEHGRPG